MGLGPGFGLSVFACSSGSLVLFPKPIDRIEREGGSFLAGCVGAPSLFLGLAGILGGCAGASSSEFLALGLGGILGLAGILAITSLSTIGGTLKTVGADLVVTRGYLSAFARNFSAYSFSCLALSSNSLFVGGSGGSFASPKAGGSFLVFEPTEPTLEAFVDKDIPEIVELYDVIELFELLRTNSVFAFGVSWADPFRGGRFGEG